MLAFVVGLPSSSLLIASLSPMDFRSWRAFDFYNTPLVSFGEFSISHTDIDGCFSVRVDPSITAAPADRPAWLK
jgi:hypothetical protein